jgi:hypothetical protein
LGGLMTGLAHGGRLMFVGLLMASGLGSSLADQPSGTLTVSGHSGQVPVTQINGRSYVAVDALARLMNGSLGYQGNHITLTVPSGGSVAAGVPPGQPANSGFSKGFLNAGIETMSDIREWRSALLNAVQNGFPVTEPWMANYHSQAVKSLRLTSVAATTDSDHNALRLLSRELDHMQELGNKVLAARKNLSYITPEIVQKDPLDQKIMNCARSLAAMVANGAFQDNGSCN